MLVRFDPPGAGLSRRGGGESPAGLRWSDIGTLVDHIGLEHFGLLAGWGSGFSAIAYAARHADRVSHLILWSAAASARDLYSSGVGDAAVRLRGADWHLFTETIMQLMLGRSGASAVPRYAAMMRAGTSEERYLGAVQRVTPNDTSTPPLSDVQTPTLVLQRSAAPPGTDAATALASAIPEARLVVLDGDSIAPMFGDGEVVARTIERFLDEHQSRATEAARPEWQTPVGPPYPDGLSAREVQVLRLVAAGMRNAEIADRLVISINTVTRHISNIFGKTGVTNRTEATRYAIRSGLTE